MHESSTLIVAFRVIILQPRSTPFVHVRIYVENVCPCFVDYEIVTD